MVSPVPSESRSRVHHGFKTEVDDLWPAIKEDIERKPNRKKNVWFTGHSLGAAMATIMAGRCYYDAGLTDPTELYTYGSPRVGWGGYVSAIKVTHHRWVNNNDIVPKLPPLSLGYRHHGKMHYLNTWGNVRSPNIFQRMKDKTRGAAIGLSKGDIDFFVDHSINKYVRYLENYAKGIENPQPSLFSRLFKD